MVYRTLDIDAEIIGSIIEAEPEFSDVLIDAVPEFVTELHTTTYEDYTGPYELVAGEEAQTIPTDHLLMTENLIIDPVPDNYARMQWNGSTILFY